MTPWSERPYSLVSLYDMLRFYADKFVFLMTELAKIQIRLRQLGRRFNGPVHNIQPRLASA